METSKQKTVTFEFHTTDIVPEEMATTFIREDLLAEEHRKILVEQLVDIVNQLATNPDQLPSVSFPPEECFSPTRDKRDQSSEAAKTSDAGKEAVETKPPAAAEPPVRGAEKPPAPATAADVQVKRFHVSPVVENKPIVPPESGKQETKEASTTTTQTVEAGTTQMNEASTNTGYMDNSLERGRNKLEKLDINKPMSMPAPSNVTSTLSPSADMPKSAPVVQGQASPSATVTPGHMVTSPDTVHLTTGSGGTAHPSSDVSDLEANLAMVFNQKITAPTLPAPVSSVAGIVPLESASVDTGVTVIQSQYSDQVAGDTLAPPVTETDQGSSSSNQATVHSTRSLEDGLGEPVIQSTPVVTPDKSQDQVTSSTGGGGSRFAVKKVEDKVMDEPELTALSLSQTVNYHRVAAEAEHYDSSPSPGSCYDTASESVEPSHLTCPAHMGPVSAVTPGVMSSSGPATTPRLASII